MNRLNCGVQRYGWGKRGRQSMVALFKESQDNQFSLDESQPYAELWMGTHSNCPSSIISSDKALNLKEYIKQDAVGILGKDVCNRFYDDSESSGGLEPGDLPFLFKVLSIGQALSIQAHPDKRLARELHSRDPANYPDANHKPEMLVAISSRFEALCGFRPSGEIMEHFFNYPELVALCDQDNCDTFIAAVAKNESNRVIERALQKCFTSLMTKHDDFVLDRLKDLKHRLESTNSSSGVSITDRTELDSLFLRLLEKYSTDVGCFSVYLLNYIQLSQGEAIYLGASVPHAYLFGDGVECMACSDNVIRAGLTPKFKDVQVLCDMLDYSMKSSQENTLHGESHNTLSHIRLFRPPIDEFSVQEIRCNGQQSSKFELPPISTGSILIVVESSGSPHFEHGNNKQIEARSGLVYFIDSNSSVSVNLDTKSNLLAFRAYADIKK